MARIGRFVASSRTPASMSEVAALAPGADIPGKKRRLASNAPHGHLPSGAFFSQAIFQSKIRRTK